MARRDATIADLREKVHRARKDERAAEMAKEGFRAEARRLSSELHGLERLAAAALAESCLVCEPDHRTCGCTCHVGHGRARAQLAERLAHRDRRRRQGAA